MSRRDDWRPPPPRDDYYERDRYRDPRDDARGGGGYGRREEPPYRDYDRPGPYRGRDERGYGRPDESWEQERGFKRGRYDDYDAPRGGRDDYPPRGQHPGYEPYPQHEPPRGFDTPPPPQAELSSFGTAPPPSRPHNPPVQEPLSASVVMLGLPMHVTDSLLREFLEDMGASIDSTTVIMDRATGLSKRYGFAKFSSVEHARAFVEPNFPSVPWKDRHAAGPDDGMRIKINYSQKTGGWREDQGATARLTDDQRKAAELASAPLSFYVNDGTRDIGSTPNQILLLRGLDPLTTEDEIVSALRQLGGRAGEEIRKGGIRKVMLARDRASRSSWGFAFVQFADVRLATDVLGNAFNARFYPTGFRINNAVVAFSFCHENSFIPIYARSEWSFKGEGGQQLSYWDDKGFVTIWTPPTASAPSDSQAKGTASTAGDPDADMEAFLSSLDTEAPSAEHAPAPKLAGNFAPVNIKLSAGPGAAVAAAAAPSTGGNGDKKDRIASTSTTPSSPATSAAAAAAAAADAGKKKGADLIYSRKQAGNINKWNQKQAELKQPEAPPAPPSAIKSSANSTPIASMPTQRPALTASTTVSAAAADDDLEHGDPISFICLLCQRQFKSVDELKKHNKLSNLHKTNLANPKAVSDSAVRKAASVAKNAAAAAAAADPAAGESDASSTPKYIDRAAARREALGQPDHPAPEKKRRFEGPPPREPPAPPRPANVAIEETNVGSKMLEKMGWAKGAGLGAEGSGRAEPVQASQFAQGAGLGATKGVVVGTYDQSAKGYSEGLRDKARARYEAGGSK